MEDFSELHNLLEAVALQAGGSQQATPAMFFLSEYKRPVAAYSTSRVDSVPVLRTGPMCSPDFCKSCHGPIFSTSSSNSEASDTGFHCLAARAQCSSPAQADGEASARFRWKFDADLTSLPGKENEGGLENAILSSCLWASDSPN